MGVSMKPLIVSFWAPNPHQNYQALSVRMEESCHRFGLETHVVEMSNKGSWVWNCAQKGLFILNCLGKFERPILWIDADAVVNVSVVLQNLGLLDRAEAMWDNLADTASEAIHTNQQ